MKTCFIWNEKTRSVRNNLAWWLFFLYYNISLWDWRKRISAVFWKKETLVNKANEISETVGLWIWINGRLCFSKCKKNRWELGLIVRNRWKNIKQLFFLSLLLLERIFIESSIFITCSLYHEQILSIKTNYIEYVRTKKKEKNCRGMASYYHP